MTSIKPFFDNSNEATKLEDTIDLLIILLDSIILGIIYKKLRDYEKSIGCYEKAIKLDSNYKIAKGNLIEIYELYAKELFEKNLHKKALEFIKMGPGLIRFSNKDFKIL